MNSRNHMKMQKFSVCKEKFEDKHAKIEKYPKVSDHCHYTWEYRRTAHIICNLKYSVHEEISIVFHNGSNYDYHFVIKELVEESEGQITFLGENTEKYITFSVPIEKKLSRLIKKENQLQKLYQSDYNSFTV